MLARRDVRALLVLVSVPLAAYATFGGTIRENFGVLQWEDPRFFWHVQDLRSASEVWTKGSFWTGLYRPLSTNLFYYLGRTLFEHDLHVYHSILAALFVGNALLFFVVARAFASFVAAWAATLVFVTRTAHTEVPLYTSQIQSLLPATFALLAIAAVTAGRRDARPAVRAGLATFFTFLALLCKESMVVLPVALSVAAFALDGADGRAPARSPVPPHAAARARAMALRALPWLAVVAWYPLAAPHLAIRENQWWGYELDPWNLGASVAAYSLALSNTLVSPFIRHEPAVFLNEFPSLLSAALSPLGRALALLSLVAASAGVASARRLPRGLACAAAALVIFAVFLAPCVVLKDRLLAYYGYFPHAWLALAIALGIEHLIRAVRRGRHNPADRPEPRAL